MEMILFQQYKELESVMSSDEPSRPSPRKSRLADPRPAYSGYILLMRHGKKRSEGDPQPLDYVRLSKDGVKGVSEVADRLAESMLEVPPELRFRIRHIVYAPQVDEIRETLIVLKQTLNKQDPHLLDDAVDVECHELAPEFISPFGSAEFRNVLARVADYLQEKAENASSHDLSASAVLLLANQPLVGWIGHELTGTALPLSRGELACLVPTGPRWKRLPPFKRKPYSLLWTISRFDKDDHDAILQKIRSKMDAAKVLGAFITGLVAFLFAQLLGLPSSGTNDTTRWLMILAILSTSAAAWLYFATLYAYDALQMPQTFWEDEPPPSDPTNRPGWLVWRPPSSATWVLYQNMLRTWNCLFRPATVLIGVALLFLAMAAAERQRLIHLEQDVLRHLPLVDTIPVSQEVVLAVLIMAEITSLIVATKYFRPRLGVQD
jgi:hypothetical protein